MKFSLATIIFSLAAFSAAVPTEENSQLTAPIVIRDPEVFESLLKNPELFGFGTTGLQKRDYICKVSHYKHLM